ncbi:MAG: hypothetical protein JSR83_23285 [Proteobacteria bacterium]|nr:hypothetical protein [Pseudomonadota bacterium]
MPRPIRDAMGNAFRSFDTLADALRERAPSLEWPARRSLSAKIGELDRGVKTWWQRRPAQRSALLSLLSIPDADIGIFESQSDENVYHFKDFPGLPPLRLPRETAPRIGQAIPSASTQSAAPFEDWLKFETTGVARRFDPTGITWLHMPDGTGRSLLFAEMAAKCGLDALRVRTLGDSGIRMEDPKLLVLKLDEQTNTLDLRHLLRRPREAGLLIIAPTPYPHGNAPELMESFSWEFLSKEKSDRDFLTLSNPESPVSGLLGPLEIASLRWELDSDWQDRLLNWIEARLNRFQPDTLFSAEGLRQWIDKFDPLKQWISTPEELMVLCHISHRQGETFLPKATDRHVADALIEAVIRLKPGQKRVFRKLAECRWQTSALPWRGVLSESQWRSLARGTESVSQEALLAIAEAPNRERRREMALAIAEQSTRGVIDTLIEGNYLKHEGMGHYDLSPPALAKLIVRDWLLDHIVAAPLNTWAFACFDSSRRRLIDATLDCLNLDELAVLAESICHEPLWAAETLAASESVVFAIARRLVDGAPFTDSMRRCFVQVFSRLETTDSFPAHYPLTRACETNDDQLAWLVTCWAFSLAEAPSGVAYGVEDAWQFPGWFEESPDVTGGLVTEYVGDYDALKPSWRSLFKLGGRICERWKKPPAEPPEFLEPILLSAAAKGRWPAQPDWWSSVMNSKEMENTFLSELKGAGRDAALRLWPSFLRYETGFNRIDNLETARYLRCVCSESRIWILGRLNPADVLASLDDTSLRYLYNNPSTLPPAVRRALLDQVPHDARGASALLALCPDLDGDELTRWLGGSTYLVAAERIWVLPSDEILRVIERLAEGDEMKAAVLLDCCPDNRLEIALEALQKMPRLLSSIPLRQWARRRLPNAKHLSTQLIALIEPQVPRIA